MNHTREELEAQEARLTKPIPEGTRFGRLTVYGFDHTDQRGRAHYYCRCDSGRHVIVRRDNLKNGHTCSCGCLAGRRSRGVHEPR